MKPVVWLSALCAVIGMLMLLPVVAVLGIATVPPASAAAEIPADALAAYMAAARACPGLPWEVLAGIGEVESDHGRSDAPGVHSGANSAGAEGPMQFLPATFALYADPGASVYAIGPAALAAARMLCADGAPADLRTAVYAYNHSWSYVDDVLAWAARYAGDAGGGMIAAAWALGRLGAPYVWGAAGPDAYDCSGLALRAWQAAGVTLPRVAAAQYGAGSHVPYADAQVGDLVFFGPSPDPAQIDHVGIYLGSGLMVDAPHPGAVVRVEPVWTAGLQPLVTRPGT